MALSSTFSKIHNVNGQREHINLHALPTVFIGEGHQVVNSLNIEGGNSAVVVDGEGHGS